jgi:hypothetical protein
MEKKLIFSLLLICIILGLYACSGNKNLILIYSSQETSSNETIKITVNGEPGWEIEPDGSFFFIKDENKDHMLSGLLIDKGEYDSDYSYVKEEQIIETGTKDNIEYIFYNDGTYRYLCWFTDTNTGVKFVGYDKDEMINAFYKTHFEKLNE